MKKLTFFIQNIELEPFENRPHQLIVHSCTPVEHRGGENWSWQLQILIAKFDIHLFQWLFRYARLPRRLQSEKLSTLKEAKLSSSDSIAPWSKRVSNINIKIDILFKVVTWACYRGQYGGLDIIIICLLIYLWSTDKTISNTPATPCLTWIRFT